MHKRDLLLATVLLLTGSPLTIGATNTVKSGPQVGEKLAGPFQPLNITGAFAGKRHCLYCENGMRPAVMIFARQISPNVVQLLQRLDAAAASASRPMGVYVIFCDDDPNLPARLEDMAKAAKLNKMVVAAFHADGPRDYQIAADADVTVLLYNRVTVVANHAFRPGELTGQAAQAVVMDVPKILAQD